MKRIFLCLVVAFYATFCFAQKEVTILVSGEGKTKTEATDAALRSAIEQTFGAFVSTNTTILNDELVKDEIATVSSGNIEKYTEVNYFERNGKSYVTLNATISIGKLVSYAKSKGSSCELDGATFTAEIRKNKFYRENTLITIENLARQINILQQDLFVPKIRETEPKANGSVYVGVDLDINDNVLEICEDLIFNTFKSIAIDEKEAKRLQNIGERIEEIKIYDFEFVEFQGSGFSGIKKILKNTFYILWDDSFHICLDYEAKPFYLSDNLGNKYLYHRNLNLNGKDYRYTINPYGLISTFFHGDRTDLYFFRIGTAENNDVNLTAKLKKRMKIYKNRIKDWSLNDADVRQMGASRTSYYKGWFVNGKIYVNFYLKYDIETLSKITGFTIEMAE